MPASKWKESIAGALKKLTANLGLFSDLPPALQTIEAKNLIEEMTLLYERVVALEWAERHGGRYEKLMKIYIETNWEDRAVGEEKSSVSYFEDII